MALLSPFILDPWQALSLALDAHAMPASLFCSPDAVLRCRAWTSRGFPCAIPSGMPFRPLNFKLGLTRFALPSSGVVFAYCYALADQTHSVNTYGAIPYAHRYGQLLPFHANDTGSLLSVTSTSHPIYPIYPIYPISSSSYPPRPSISILLF